MHHVNKTSFNQAIKQMRESTNAEQSLYLVQFASHSHCLLRSLYSFTLFKIIMNKNENTMGMLCHLLAFVGYLGIPFGNIIGPLVIWLIKKDESQFVDECGKESLNFQISIFIYGFISGLLCFIFIGFPLLFAVLIGNIVFIIKASVASNNGELYRYPFTIRFIS